ncbi:18819_t:CDS:2, partial [Gigaspora margarita]
TKKSQIFASLQKTTVHYLYKRDLQVILKTEPPEDIFFAIMKQLIQKITEKISTLIRIKFSTQSEKVENGKYEKVEINKEQIKFWAGNNNQTNNLTNQKYPNIVNEIKNYKEKQKSLTSLETTFKVWLQKTLSSTTSKELYKYFIKQLQSENITDQDKKLYEIFEVLTPFKLVKYVFRTITIYWIEKEIILTKATEFVDNPIGELVSKKANVLATDLIYNIDVINIESLEGPFQQDRKHTFKDLEKIFNTEANILLTSFLKYLGANIETTKKFKTLIIEVSLYKPWICKEIEVRSTIFLFALSSIGEYMYIFELMRQEVIQELFKETNKVKKITSEIFSD